MTIEDKTKHEKLQYDISSEGAKISALSSGEIDKYEYLTGEEILPSDQSRIVEEARFTYSPLGKAFEKRTKIHVFFRIFGQQLLLLEIFIIPLLKKKLMKIKVNYWLKF